MTGPSVLTSPDQSERAEDYVQEDEVNSELRSRYQVTVQLVNQDTELFKPVLCLERYSKLKTVFRVTAWIKRFIANLHSSTKMRGELTAEEQHEAEKYWIKATQSQSFSPEINLL